MLAFAPALAITILAATIVTPFERRSFLLGALGGVGAGAAAGLGASYLANPARHEHSVAELAKQSYAQQGEDLILENIFAFLQIRQPTYLDVGAHLPVQGNNTYLFYRHGSRGVLVEPNPALTPALRRARPRDVVLEVGVGANAGEEEADYFIIKGDGQGNTFSEDQVRKLVAAKGPDVVGQVIKRKLVNINKLIAEHFPAGAPDLLSTDTEGYDLRILQSLDFDRCRPPVLCVETLEDLQVQKPILDYMQSKDYEVRGATFVNTIFVDNRYSRDGRSPTDRPGTAAGPLSSEPRWVSADRVKTTPR